MLEDNLEQEFLPPGSDAALDAGCRCPVLDNGHGRGFPGKGGKTDYWINPTCELPGHGVPLKITEAL